MEVLAGLFALLIGAVLMLAVPINGLRFRERLTAAPDAGMLRS